MERCRNRRSIISAELSTVCHPFSYDDEAQTVVLEALPMSTLLTNCFCHFISIYGKIRPHKRVCYRVRVRIPLHVCNFIRLTRHVRAILSMHRLSRKKSTTENRSGTIEKLESTYVRRMLINVCEVS